MMHQMTYKSPLGDLTLLSDDTYLIGLWIKGQKNYGETYNLKAAERTENKPIHLAMLWLEQYFSGNNPDVLDVPLNPEVTSFRNMVLKTVSNVPYGQTITYKQIANTLQNNDSSKQSNKARAVGNALGHNPIMIIVPCHRVIGSNGSLMGYAGGLDRKRSLLNLEQKYQSIEVRNTNGTN